MIIKNNSKKIIVIGKVVLYPKVNMISEDQEAILIPAYEKDLEGVPCLEISDLKIIDKKTRKQKSVTSITELSGRKALSLVKETVIKKTLETFLSDEEENENRTNVIKAVNKQLENLE